jgi:hypothetical protein
MDDDDTALDGGADVGPVNLWKHSIFSDVSVSLNENLVSPPTSLYPYRAYIEILLSYGPAAKESQLTGSFGTRIHRDIKIREQPITKD